MGYELINESGQKLYYNFTGYPKLIELALQYGWEPLGTTMPSWHDEKIGKRDDWPGIYCSNDHQVVSAEDANNMADALERSIADISAKPVYSADEKDVTKVKCADGSMIDTVPLGYHDDRAPISFWGGNPKTIKKLIKFLRLGSYETW